MTGNTGFHLDVGGGHQIWLQPWGNPEGLPVLFLHGGPGSGCNPGQSALFDAARHRVIFMDQRGAGQSLPHRGREANTTAHVLADIEKLRRHCGIERWLVVGGSWGATLALAYAQKWPERVTGIVLRATFLGTRAELDWAFGTGLRTFHPGLQGDLLALLPECERADPLPALWRRILDPDPRLHRPAALGWYQVERALSELTPGVTRLASAGPDDCGTSPLPATPFMEAHYFLNDCFLAPDALLAGAGRLSGIPGRIVQARYDLLCPPITAHRLAKAWPEAKLIMVETAGHSLGHPEVARAVRAGVADLTPG